MRVAVEQIEFDRLAVLDEIVSERAQTRAAVKNQKAVAAADLHTRGVAAIAYGFGSGAGNAAANSPKPDAKVPFRQNRYLNPPGGKVPYTEEFLLYATPAGSNGPDSGLFRLFDVTAR